MLTSLLLLLLSLLSTASYSELGVLSVGAPVSSTITRTFLGHWLSLPCIDYTGRDRTSIAGLVYVNLRCEVCLCVRLIYSRIGPCSYCR